MNFAHPAYLWLLLLLVPVIAWHIYQQKKKYASLGLSTTASFAKAKRSYKEVLLKGLFILRVLTIAALIIIIARPQVRDKWSKTNTEGTDIVLAIDLSTSMLARDFTPNRFEAAKKVAANFVSGRESDNMGLVIFAGESFTALPMTTDRSLMANYINDLSIGMLEDGTAIGDGLATSINRIKDGKAKSKSIILLTDGSNNTGNVAPLTASEIAKKLGIKVYTIGVGKNGNAPYPVPDIAGRITYSMLPVTIDEPTLKSIAQNTGGKYFRATDGSVLSDIFKEIDQLEKSRIDVQNFSHTEDNYMPWAILAVILLGLELLLRHAWLRPIP
ncbi:MAG: VWA domain-containing protein [Firmicutes bacterium]|nr:VWA domain-containing protein [Bacillota bacterium]MCM1400840.1 VWA domain-containing protein [Bacteroides sp.]MCM1476669.1 VWA domain-containing protein [Bacteroides sp.]